MADPIIGAALGGAARLAPEILKFFDRRNERKHELALAEHQLELIRVQHHYRHGHGWRRRLAQWWARNLNVFDDRHIK